MSIISMNCFGQTYYSSYYGNGVSVHSTTRISGSYGSISGTYSISSGGYHSSGSFHYSTSIPSYSSCSGYSSGYSNYSNRSNNSDIYLKNANDSIIKEENKLYNVVTDTSLVFMKANIVQNKKQEKLSIVENMYNITKMIRYPSRAQENNIQGYVVATFIIDENGIIQCPKIIKSLDPDCDREVLRIIKTLNNKDYKIIPAKNKDNNNISVRYSMPVKFTLN